MSEQNLGHEGFTPKTEKSPEHIPTREEILALFDQLTNGERKGKFKEGAAAISTIQVSFWKADMVENGETLADFVDNEWIVR